MDDFDRKILLVLKGNARISFTELSKTVNLSAPAIHTRLQRLEEKGYIRSFSTIFNPEKFGKNFTCFCLVQLSSHTISDDDEFTKFVIENPDILECHRITGQFEYMLKIVTTSSKKMEELIRKMRANEKVTNTNTFTILVTQKEEPTIIPE
jgi:Lrp/AsnC family leucine-responsive transcriptional regulator